MSADDNEGGANGESFSKVTIWRQVIAGILSGTLLATVISSCMTGFTTRIAIEVRGRHEWKEKAVSELLGLVDLQFDRTRRAFERYNDKNLYLEAKVLKEGNEAIRSLLLSRAYLIPPELRDDAAKLVQHYDVWLEVFEKTRGGTQPDLNSPFVFAGPAGYPFPTESETHFRTVYSNYWNELYRSN